MAYSDMHEVTLAALVSCAATGDKGSFTFPSGGVIRRIGISYHTEPTGAGVVKFDKTNTAGTRGDGDVDTLNIAAAHDIGDVVYKDINVSVSAGETVTAECTTGATGATLTSIFLIYSPSWKTPAEDTRFNLTT